MRLWPIAGIAMLGLATTFSACGDDGEATAGKDATAQLEQQASAPVGGRRCERQVGEFVDSLDAMRRRLAVGLTYDAYVDEVRRLRTVYRDVPVDRLDLGCLVAAGAPGERAFNEYIDAANAWGDCLATAGCDTGTVEPELQRGWEIASNHLSKAQRGLRG